jgi:hypothetical protein
VRIAENESRFRAINQRLADDVEPLVDDVELLGFVCECGQPTCTEALDLSVAEYRRVREDPMRFAVLPGHEIEDVEEVVASAGRYLVIRKFEQTRPIAEATDPT